MQRIVNESDYCKKWNVSQVRKLTLVTKKVFLFEKYQGTGALNNKPMFVHLRLKYILYILQSKHISLHIPHKLFL